MKNLAKYTAGFGLVLALVLMGAAPSWSKAHDQGVADVDGTNVPGNQGGTGVGGPGGISGGQNSDGTGQGFRGGASSTAKGGNSGDKGDVSTSAPPSTP